MFAVISNTPPEKSFAGCLPSTTSQAIHSNLHVRCVSYLALQFCRIEELYCRKVRRRTLKMLLITMESSAHEVTKKKGIAWKSPFPWQYGFNARFRRGNNESALKFSTQMFPFHLLFSSQKCDWWNQMFANEWNICEHLVWTLCSANDFY